MHAAGGLLTGTVGRQWVMFVNVPLGVGIAVLAGRVLPADHDLESTNGFDLGGAALVTGAAAAPVYALTQAATRGCRPSRTQNVTLGDKIASDSRAVT